MERSQTEIEQHLDGDIAETEVKKPKRLNKPKLKRSLVMDEEEIMQTLKGGIASAMIGVALGPNKEAIGAAEEIISGSGEMAESSYNGKTSGLSGEKQNIQFGFNPKYSLQKGGKKDS